MRNLLLTLLGFFIITNLSGACDVEDLGKTLPTDFDSSCYEYVTEFKTVDYMVDIGTVERCMPWSTFIIESDRKVDAFISGFKLNPYKLYKKTGDLITYKINLEGDIRYLNDNNEKTFLEFDTQDQTSLLLEFDDIIRSGTSLGNFIYKSKNYYIEYLISLDGVNFSKINVSYSGNQLDIGDFNFKYLKINFVPKNKNELLREKIQVYELRLFNTGYKYILKARGDVITYSNNLCKDKNLYLSNDTGDYDLNSSTKVLSLSFVNNEGFDVISDKDKDKDGIGDSIDNCQTIKNPDQKDTNGDGKGDMCSDDDRDGILGYKDNCIDIYNPLQEDININGVGDKCEFDKDKDGVFDYLDNCINISNPLQEDKDRDGIGDICDNCEGYNPKQLDINGNGIGDICDKESEYLKDHDEDGDLIRDDKDNCKSIANYNQLDTDNDGVGDLCDNCINIMNFNQLDDNKNGVGDLCEDGDGDGIDGITDNCINIYNPDQLDTDNDRIGDLCEDQDNDNILANKDNCPFHYNPNQSDIDNDGIGDKCDDKDNRFFESNKNLFIGLLVIVVVIFLFFIAIMARKLNSED